MCCERVKRVTVKMIKQISIPPLESILPTTRKVDEAGQTRRTLPIFQTFFSIENEEEGSTFGKHELDCRSFDPPCRPRPSDREFFIFLLKTCWKESNRVDRGEEDTLYGKMFHGDRCKSASIPFPSPPRVKIRQIRMKRAVGPPFSLEPRDGRVYYVRSCTCQSWGYGFRFQRRSAWSS